MGQKSRGDRFLVSFIVLKNSSVVFSILGNELAEKEKQVVSSSDEKTC